MFNPQTRARFLRFLVVGGAGFVVQLGSLWVLKRYLLPGVAFTIAFILSVTAHYSLNRFWALRSHRRDSGRQLLEYLGTVGLSYLVSFACFNLFLHVLKLSIMLSTALAVPPSTIIVFLLLNYRVFKHENPAA